MPDMKELGRKGGQSRSEAKRRAARLNAKKGREIQKAFLAGAKRKPQ